MKLRRHTALVLTVTLLSMGSPGAEGALIGAESAGTSERASLVSFLHRSEVAEGLKAHGVTLNEAEARVAALTDDEAAQLAATIENAPAGGIGPETGLYLVIGIFYLFGVVMAAISRAVMR